MDRTVKVELTNMCMVKDGKGRVLVQDRKKEDWPGITFPGGHVEPDESFTDAIIREVYEETGLKISSPQLCGIKDWINDDGSRYMVLFYQTDRFEGEIVSSEEGEVFWVPIEELTKRNLSEGFDQTLKVFLNEYLSEQYFYKEDGEWVEVLK